MNLKNDKTVLRGTLLNVADDIDNFAGTKTLIFAKYEILKTHEIRFFFERVIRFDFKSSIFCLF